MSEDDAFLRKLLEQPNSDLTRLVYADWLDEQQTPDSVAKAEYLRLIADGELAGSHTDRAAELARELDPHWLAVVAKLPVENCDRIGEPGVRMNALGVEFEYECPKRWEELTPTGDGYGVRFCGACEKTVHYCKDADDVRVNANLGNCVAVELGVPRRPGDLEPELFMVTMGIVGPDTFGPEAAGQVRQRIMDEAAATGRARRRRRQRRNKPEE